jgi:peptidoglycan/LPS O-acetylase OafA/YrhL
MSGAIQKTENPAKQKIHDPAEPGRVSAIDFTKGALVLIMVLYHWINYFIGADWPYYRYLRFLTPSFIFVSGFLVSSVLLAKYGAADGRLSRRLVTRGLKLLALFVALNGARMVLLSAGPNRILFANQLSPEALAAIFAVGNVFTASGRVVAFYILVPIGYLLILSGAMVFPHRAFRYAYHVLCLFFLAGILVIDLSGFTAYNLEFVTIGFLGILAGFIPIQKVNRLVDHPYLLVVAYACYTVVISIWDVPFPLLVAGACLSIGAIYLVGLKSGDSNPGYRHVTLLGRYSLFGYVAQIAILQFLSMGLRHVVHGYTLLGISFVAAFVLTIGAVEALDRSRARSRSLDRAYKAVFA